jgi:hypothetical protein
LSGDNNKNITSYTVPSTVFFNGLLSSGVEAFIAEEAKKMIKGSSGESPAAVVDREMRKSDSLSALRLGADITQPYPKGVQPTEINPMSHTTIVNVSLAKGVSVTFTNLNDFRNNVTARLEDALGGVVVDSLDAIA